MENGKVEINEVRDFKIAEGSDDYVSGQQLCERFQVSRTAVWKVVDQLKKEGYGLRRCHGRGTAL